MFKSRVFTILLIGMMWFSTSGFERSIENLRTLSPGEPPSVGAPSVLAAAVLGKLLPVDGATDVSATALELSWTAVTGYEGTGTISYRYCIQPANKKSCPPGKWRKVGGNTSVTVGSLLPNTSYRWWARAYVGKTVIAEADGGSYWALKTQALPQTFLKTTPGNFLNEQDTTDLQFTWDPSTSANYYEFCLDNSNNNTCDTGWVKVLSGTSLTIPSLYNNAIYYWQVRAVNNGGSLEANSGTWWQFTTRILSGVFDKLSPSYNATGQLANGLIISWGYSEGASSYQYCLTQTAPPTDHTCDTGWQNPANLTSTMLPTLQYNQLYYWQVRAYNGIDYAYANTDAGTGVDEWWMFTIQGPPPETFGKALPINGAQNQYTDILLTWQTSANAVRYEYCLIQTNATPSDCDTPWTEIEGNWVIEEALELSTTYYWQVRAVNATATVAANNGTWWSFKTQSGSPNPFYKSLPATDSTGQSTTLTLSWTPTSTTDANYQVCYDTTNDDVCQGENWSAPQAATTFSPTGLISGTKYYWQVRAVNATGTTYADGDMIAWWNFTTQYAAPTAFEKSGPGDGAADQPTDVSLSWNTSSPGATYEYCVGVNAGTCLPEYDWISTTGLTASLVNLNRATTYYWQVRARNQDSPVTEANGGAWWSFTTIPNPPAAFTKDGPADASTDVTISPTLMWNPSTTAGANYAICYDTSDDDACEDDNWRPAASAGAYALEGLMYSQQCFWQVRASNAGGETFADGETEWWSFTTIAPPHGAFSKNQPGNGDVRQETSLSLSWIPANGITDYQVCYDRSDDNTCDDDDWHPVTGDTYLVSGLDYHTTYYWQVKNTSAEANAGTWWSFTTKIPPPAGFDKSGPGDGAADQPLDPLLEWGASDPGITYEYCVGLSAGNCLAQYSWLSTTNLTAHLTGLERETTYYWQVRAKNTEGATTDANGSAWWSSTTIPNPPAAFHKNGPANASTGILVDSSLTWTPSATPGANDTVCLDTTDDDACEDNDWRPATTEGAFQLSGLTLTLGQTYYWQVRASNTGGDTFADGAAEWWSFRVKLPAPAAFGKSLPQNNAPSLSPTPTLTWTASNPGVTYQYCVSTTSGVCGEETNWKTTTGASAVPTGLSYATTYYWQVRAKNSENTITEANGGTWWRFTTYSQPPADFRKTSPAHNATNQPVNLTLNWTNAGSGFHYEYCVTIAPSVTCPGTWPSVTTTSVQVTGLASNTAYNWQVRAVDSSGHATYANALEASPFWRFTTRPAPPSSNNVTYNVNEDQSLARDLPGVNQMTFALYGAKPAGTLVLSSNGNFTYQPPLNFFGQVKFQFTVTDNINPPVGPYTATINFAPVNDPPVLNPIADITKYSGKVITITPSASDPDTGTKLTYSISSLPAGATFDGSTGVLRWMANWSPGNTNEYTLTITVSDGVATATPVQRTFKITVLENHVFFPMIQLGDK